MVGVVGAIVWENLTVAGAFLLGAALATVATLRVGRIISEYFSKKDR